MLIITLFVAYIHTATLFEYKSTTTNVNASSSVAADPVCYSQEHIALHPTTQDCLRAQEGLPSGTRNSVFHRGGPADGFRLPYFHSFDTCTIVVDFERDMPDVCSWNIISLSTRTTVYSCSVGRLSEAKTGGYTHVGLVRRIRIRLLRY